MILRFIAYFAGILLACYLAGLVAFAVSTDERAGSALARPADGIVVLTGGSGERIAEGARLLEEGLARRMLISGVHESVSRRALQRLSGLETDMMECCVDVDRVARNTVGNAREIGQWQQNNGYHSLLVVTSAYHMPRALLEMNHVMSDVKLIPVPVRSTGIARSHVVRRTINEYNKFLVVLLVPGTRDMEPRNPA